MPGSDLGGSCFFRFGFEKSYKRMSAYRIFCDGVGVNGSESAARAVEELFVFFGEDFERNNYFVHPLRCAESGVFLEFFLPLFVGHALLVGWAFELAIG